MRVDLLIDIWLLKTCCWVCWFVFCLQGESVYGWMRRTWMRLRR